MAEKQLPQEGQVLGSHFTKTRLDIVNAPVSSVEKQGYIQQIVRDLTGKGKEKTDRVLAQLDQANPDMAKNIRNNIAVALKNEDVKAAIIEEAGRIEHAKLWLEYTTLGKVITTTAKVALFPLFLAGCGDAAELQNSFQWTEEQGPVGENHPETPLSNKNSMKLTQAELPQLLGPGEAIYLTGETGPYTGPTYTGVALRGMNAAYQNTPASPLEVGGEITILGTRYVMTSLVAQNSDVGEVTLESLDGALKIKAKTGEPLKIVHIVNDQITGKPVEVVNTGPEWICEVYSEGEKLKTLNFINEAANNALIIMKPGDTFPLFFDVLNKADWLYLGLNSDGKAVYEVRMK